MNKLQLIVLCNGGSQAYCANVLLLIALIRKLVQNEAELFSAKGMHVTFQDDVLFLDRSGNLYLNDK